MRWFGNFLLFGLFLVLVSSCIPSLTNPNTEEQSVSWQILGKALDTEQSNDAGDASIALGLDGNPVVAWAEVGNIYVKRWLGASWQNLGEALDVDLARALKSAAINQAGKQNPH